MCVNKLARTAMDPSGSLNLPTATWESTKLDATHQAVVKLAANAELAAFVEPERRWSSSASRWRWR